MPVIIGSGGGVIVSGGAVEVDTTGDSTLPCTPNNITINCIDALQVICPATPRPWILPTKLNAIIFNKVGYFTSWPDTAVLEWSMANNILFGGDLWIADFGENPFWGTDDGAHNDGLTLGICQYCDPSLTSATPLLQTGLLRYTTAFGPPFPFGIGITFLMASSNVCPVSFYPYQQTFHFINVITGGDAGCVPGGRDGTHCIQVGSPYCDGLSSCDVTVFA